MTVVGCSWSIVLDLSAALDTLDYNILLERLNRVEMPDTALQWVASDILGSSQPVVIDGVKSNPLDLQFAWGASGISSGTHTAYRIHSTHRGSCQLLQRHIQLGVVSA